VAIVTYLERSRDAGSGMSIRDPINQQSAFSNYLILLFNVLTYSGFGSQFAIRNSQFAIRGSQFAIRSSRFADSRIQTIRRFKD
jgi:hypothetical protein